MAVKIHVEVCWDVTPYSVVVEYQRFGAPCCLQFILKIEAAWTSETLVSYHNLYKASQPRRPGLEHFLSFTAFANT